MGNILKQFDLLSVKPIDKIRFKNDTYEKSTIGGIASLLCVLILIYLGYLKWNIIHYYTNPGIIKYNSFNND